MDGYEVNVCDWEGGRGARPPLTDIVVFLNHYGRALPDTRYQLRARADAFHATFTGDGWLARTTARSLHDAFGRLGLPPEVHEYLFVATLLDLADGTAPAAHAATNTGFWTGAVVDYARHRDTAAIARGPRLTA